MSLDYIPVYIPVYKSYFFMYNKLAQNDINPPKEIKSTARKEEVVSGHLLQRYEKKIL